MLQPEQVEKPFGAQLIEIDDVEVWVAYLEIETPDEEIVLHPFNSLVRLFGVDHGSYANHIELRVDDRLKGIRVPQGIIDAAVAYDWSYRWDARIDEQTLKWLGGIELSHLDEELGQL